MDVDDHEHEENHERMESYNPPERNCDTSAWFDRHLYTVLVQKTCGKPLQTVKNLEKDVECRVASTAAWAKILQAGKGRSANRALILTGQMDNPKRFDNDSEVPSALEKRKEWYVKEFGARHYFRMGGVTRTTSLRQMVPRSLTSIGPP